MKGSYLFKYLLNLL